MKTRLAISAIAAALTGFICAALAEREGDPAAVIAEVEERLAELSPLRANLLLQQNKVLQGSRGESY